MGMGYVADILEAVERGVDLFDCVLPTRNARNGSLFTRRGVVVIKNRKYADDPRPARRGLLLLHLPDLSRRAYLRHLFERSRNHLGRPQHRSTISIFILTSSPKYGNVFNPIRFNALS